MAKEIYRLSIDIDMDNADDVKKALSKMDKEAEKFEKRLKQLDKLDSAPSVRLEDKLTGPMDKIESRIGKFAKGAMKKFAAIATAGAVLVGGLGVRDVMTTFMDFEQGMANVQAVSRATGDELQALTDEAKRLGRETEWSAVQVSEAEMLLAQAGFSVQENIAALPGLLSLASAGGLELSDATDIAAGTLRAFGLEAKETGRVADILAVAASSTNSDVYGLGEAMKYVGPVAKGLNISLEETTAALGMLHDANIKGGQAGTVLRGALNKLAKPSKEASELMHRLGFEAFDARGNILPLDQVIGNLQKSTADLSAEQKANAMVTMFGQQNMAGMLALVEQGPDKLAELTKSLQESSGAAAEMADARLDSLSGQFTILQSAVEGMKIELGERLAPYTRKFVEWITPKIPLITDKIVELVGKMQEFGTKAFPKVKTIFELVQKLTPLFAGVGAALATIKIASVIGNGIKVFKKLSGGASALKTAFSLAGGGATGLKAVMGALMGPVSWVALAIGAAVTAGILLYKNWDKIKEKASQLGSWISDKWNGIKEATSEKWNSIKESVSEKWSSLKDTITGIGPAIKEGVTGTWDKIKTGTVEKWNSIKEGVSNKVLEIKSAIEDKFLSLPDSILEPFERMKESISGVFDGIIQIFTGVWEVVKNIFLGALLIIIDIVTLDFEKLSTDISQIWENIKEGFSMVWEGIKEVFINSLEFIKAYADLIWNGIKETISLVWTSVTEFLAQTWESIKETAIEGWNSFKEGVSNIITGITTWIKTTWNATIEWFSTLPGRLLAKGVEMFTALQEGLASMKESVISRAKEVGTGIVDAIKELPSKMVSIGKDIMTGLANGIKNGIMAPINAAKNAASRVGDAIRDKLKIKSPSRVMMEYGGFTTEGLAIGMEKQFPMLERVSGGTVDVITREQAKEMKVMGSSPTNIFNSQKSTPQVAVATGGGGNTTIINIDGTTIEVSGTNEDGGSKTDEEMIDEAMRKFGKKLLDALKDKK